MDLSLRLRLSMMMFLQYFVWGAWGVVIFKFLGRLPTEGGLNFPGDLQGWIGSTLPIGAMISPLFIGLFADRFFSSEKVLAILHLVGAGLLGWAAWTCDRGLPNIQEAFQTAAKAAQLEEGNLLDAFNREKELKKEWDQAPDSQKEDLGRRLKTFQVKKEKVVKQVNDDPKVKEAISATYMRLLWLFIGYALCFMPTLTLTNSLSFRNLSDPDKYFGGIRVWGTNGWIVANWVVGFALNEVSTQPLYLAMGSSVALGFFCLALPHTPPSGGAKTLGDSLGLPALAMLKDISFLVFFVCSFLITIVLAFYYQQGNAFITDLQTPYPAAVQTLGQISEIFFMLLIPVGLRKLGTKGMLVLGMLAWCLRYAIFASQNVPAVIALGLPLHGVCYDFFFVVSYLYVDRQAPKQLRASAQGLITFVTLGVGMFLGNILAGDVVKRYTEGSITHWTSVWLVPLTGSAVATLLFALLFREAKATVDVGVGKTMEALEPSEPPDQVH